jgi:hypothetical protein
MSEIELKPCPLCGKPAESRSNGKLAACSNQLCWWAMDVPVKYWNTRPIEDAITKRAERAEAANECQIAATKRMGEIAQEFSNRALQAYAELKAVKAELADYKASYQRVLDEQCGEDEQHCTCVPALRIALKAAQEDANRLADALTNLNRACWLADIDGDLSAWIDGSMLTDSDSAIAAHNALKGPQP